MRFMMLMIPEGYATAGPDKMPDPEAMAGMMKYNEALKAAGVLLSLDGLHPPSDGARVTFNGRAAPPGRRRGTRTYGRQSKPHPDGGRGPFFSRWYGRSMGPGLRRGGSKREPTTGKRGASAKFGDCGFINSVEAAEYSGVAPPRMSPKTW